MANLREAKESILQLAEADILFRNALVDDPKKAIEKHFPDYKIPKEINFRVCEDNGNTVFLNLETGEVHKKNY